MASDIPPPATHEDDNLLAAGSTFPDPYFTGTSPLERLREFRLCSLIDSTLLSLDKPPLVYLGPELRDPGWYAAFPDFPIYGDDFLFHGQGPTGPAHLIIEYGAGLRVLKHWSSNIARRQWIQWNQYMKRFKVDHWQSLGIYHLLEFSTHPYGRHSEAIAALLHFWESPTIPSPSVIVPFGEVLLAMLTSDEGPSTLHDPPAVIIVGPFPELKLTLSEPDFIITADPPIAPLLRYLLQLILLPFWRILT